MSIKLQSSFKIQKIIHRIYLKNDYGLCLAQVSSKIVILILFHFAFIEKKKKILESWS